MNLIETLNWRYATKAMNGETIPANTLQNILDATQLTASSYGLQPYKVVVVSNTAKKEAIQAAAYGQVQVGSSSHLLVFCIPTALSTSDAETFIQNVTNTRHLPADALNGYQAMIAGTINSLNQEQQQNWAAKQVYIALGTALIAAASNHVDACPMEGFDAAKVEEILNLTEKGLKAVVMLPLGYRADSDATSAYTKVRKPTDELYIIED